MGWRRGGQDHIIVVTSQGFCISTILSLWTSHFCLSPLSKKRSYPHWAVVINGRGRRERTLGLLSCAVTWEPPLSLHSGEWSTEEHPANQTSSWPGTCYGPAPRGWHGLFIMSRLERLSRVQLGFPRRVPCTFQIPSFESEFIKVLPRKCLLHSLVTMRRKGLGREVQGSSWRGEWGAGWDGAEVRAETLVSAAAKPWVLRPGPLFPTLMLPLLPGTHRTLLIAAIRGGGRRLAQGVMTSYGYFSLLSPHLL